MKKALMLSSVASMIDQFNMENIKILKNLGYEVHVLANFSFGNTTSDERTKEFKEELENMGIKVYNVPIPRKITAIKEMISSYKKIKKVCSENNYDILHCHSPIGGVLARFAFKDFRKKGGKLIYTAHGFHFFKGAPIKNWIIFYPIEKFCSRYTDCLITINKEDYKRAKNFKAKEVKYVPGIGIDTKKIKDIKKNRKILNEFNIKDEVVLVSVGELSNRKNHKVILKALEKVKGNFKYIICGQGAKKEELIKLSKELNLQEKVEFLGYRQDVKEILKTSDIFCFPSKQEGLPVALMEAMASGLPVICSDIRGNKDLIENKKGGYLLKSYDIDEYSIKIQELIENKFLREEMGNFNLEKIKDFDRKKVNTIMEEIYNEL
ncbi:MAG: glycosyltransferase family 4 protein [Clostridium sp.]|jgi:glycosyltransferase involved in cell wall biosynthesis|nr:glycosyltransferase family 4 protein [Clostridium sp.]